MLGEQRVPGGDREVGPAHAPGCVVPQRGPERRAGVVQPQVHVAVHGQRGQHLQPGGVEPGGAVERQPGRQAVAGLGDAAGRRPRSSSSAGFGTPTRSRTRRHSSGCQARSPGTPPSLARRPRPAAGPGRAEAARAYSAARRAATASRRVLGAPACPARWWRRPADHASSGRQPSRTSSSAHAARSGCQASTAAACSGPVAATARVEQRVRVRELHQRADPVLPARPRRAGGRAAGRASARPHGRAPRRRRCPAGRRAGRRADRPARPRERCRAPRGARSATTLPRSSHEQCDGTTTLLAAGSRTCARLLAWGAPTDDGGGPRGPTTHRRPTAACHRRGSAADRHRPARPGRCTRSGLADGRGAGRVRDARQQRQRARRQHRGRGEHREVGRGPEGLRVRPSQERHRVGAPVAPGDGAGRPVASTPAAATSRSPCR